MQDDTKKCERKQLMKMEAYRNNIMTKLEVVMKKMRALNVIQKGKKGYKIFYLLKDEC